MLLTFDQMISRECNNSHFAFNGSGVWPNILPPMVTRELALEGASSFGCNYGKKVAMNDYTHLKFIRIVYSGFTTIFFLIKNRIILRNQPL